MLTELRAGPYTLRGISVAGVYTSLLVPELQVLLDAGVPIRSFAGADRLFLSHTHSDHASALVSLLGIRNLIGKGTVQVFLPAERAAELRLGVEAMARAHHTRFDVEWIPLEPGDTHDLGRGLRVRAFRTDHSAPSLGYLFSRRVTKLRPAFRHLPPEEIRSRRQAGDASLFEEHARVELGYATDTRASVLDSVPELCESRVLVFEATYLDERRSVEEARERGHSHLDELFERAERIRSEAVVLMHFSQIYSPAVVRHLVASRTPPVLAGRVLPFVPDAPDWFG